MTLFLMLVYMNGMMF